MVRPSIADRFLWSAAEAGTSTASPAPESPIRTLLARWDNGAVCAIRKGAAQQVIDRVQMYGAQVPPEARHFADSVAASGGTPLLVPCTTGTGRASSA